MVAAGSSTLASACERRPANGNQKYSARLIVRRMRGYGAGTLAGALDGMSSLNPCIYPTEKWSYLLESSLPNIVRSGSIQFLIRAHAGHDNLHVTQISPQGKIDIPRMRSNAARTA